MFKHSTSIYALKRETDYFLTGSLLLFVSEKRHEGLWHCHEQRYPAVRCARPGWTPGSATFVSRTIGQVRILLHVLAHLFDVAFLPFEVQFYGCCAAPSVDVDGRWLINLWVNRLRESELWRLTSTGRFSVCVGFKVASDIGCCLARNQQITSCGWAGSLFTINKTICFTRTWRLVRHFYVALEVCGIES